MAVVEAVSRNRWTILLLALLTQFSGTLAGIALAPLAPLFQPELGLTKAEVGLFASAVLAGTLSVLLVGGSLSDRFGIRRVVSPALLTMGALLISVALTSTFLQAVVVMFLVGWGRGIAFPGSTKAIVEWFPNSVRSTAMGLKQTGGPLSGMIAAATLPALALLWGWRPAVAAAGLAILLCGIALAALYRRPPWVGRNPRIAHNPRADLADVFRNRRLWSVSWTAFLFVSSQMCVTTYLTLYLSEAILVPSIPDERARIVAAGGYLALFQFGGILGRIFWGVIADRAFPGGRLAVLATIGALSAVATGALALLNSGHPLWLLTAIILLAGVSLVGWNGVYHTVTTEAVGQQRAGVGVGLSMTISEVGSVIAPPLFGLVLDFTNSYSFSWLLLSGITMLGILVALLEQRNSPSRYYPEHPRKDELSRK